MVGRVGASAGALSAARGRAQSCNGTPARVSRVRRIEDAHLAYDLGADFDAVGNAEFLALRRCWRSRGFGDFWSHVLVADGSIDIAVEVGGLNVWTWRRRW